MRHTSLKAIILLGAITTVLGAGGAGAAATAGQPRAKTEVACSFVKVIKTLSPPVATDLIQWTFSSHAPQPGSCKGLFKGHKIIGPSTYSDHGKANGNCALGSGFADYTIALQTTGGPRVIRGRHSFQYLNGTGSYGQASGQFQFNGQFQFAPTPDGGHCTPNDPATKVTVDQAMTMVG